MDIASLKKQMDDKYSELFKECGVFFAFSNKQFAENKTPLREGEKYVSIGAGGYMPKGNTEKYIEGNKAITKWYKEATKDEKLRKANIIYELNNHEAFDTYDLDSTMDALGSDYTREEVSKVFNDNRPN
jgi:hypothetical protein